MNDYLEEGKINIDAFDILKGILSVFVLLIHTGFLEKITYPWLDIAVPLFFMMSSYFLFAKIKNSLCQRKILKNFLKRNMTLYLFWFLVLFPVTWYIREWNNMSAFEFIKVVIKSFFFNGTFRASWFIMALCIDIVIIYFFSKKISNEYLLTITCFIYAICCVFSRYGFFVAQYPNLLKVYNLYINTFLSLGNSFPVGLFWVALGKVFVDYPLKNSKNFTVIAICTAIAVLVEHLLLLNAKLPFTGCNFLMIPLCVYVFTITLNSKIKCKYSRVIRKLSTITFCSHASIVTILSALLHYLNVNVLLSQFLNTIITFIICCTIGFVILKLEKNKYFKWLSFSH